MKKCKTKSILITLIAILIMTSMFTVTALAAANDHEDEDDLSDILIPIPIVVIADPTPAPRALTPDGNLSLIDDIQTQTIEDKQFITVTTKNGNYFYIIVDRAGDEENVYFLNMVDEYDLFQLLDEDEDPPEINQPEPFIPIPLNTPEPDNEPKQESNEKDNGNLIAIGVFIVIAIIGAGVYFKIIKPKQSKNTRGSVVDEREFDDINQTEEKVMHIGNKEDETPEDEEPGIIQQADDEDEDDDEEYAD